MKAPSILEKVKITPGGFIAAETVLPQSQHGQRHRNDIQ